MTSTQKLAKEIVKNGWYKQGQFKLSSGKESDYYIDMRQCMLSTKYVHLITTCFIEKLCHWTHKDGSILQKGNLLCGVLTSGLFLTGVIVQRLSTSELSDTSAIYVRTEKRTHGECKVVEGHFECGQEVIVIDDVATSGKSLCKIIEVLDLLGLKIKAALVIVDRNEGAKELLAQLNVPLISCITIDDIKKEL